MTVTGKSKPAKKRSCCLYSLLVLFVIFVIMSGVFAWFYVNPISTDVLNDRVRHRLERISGLNVSYDSASLTLSTGQYSIRNLRFIDKADQNNTILEIDQILATVRPWEVFVNPEAFITSVKIIRPSPLDMVYSIDSVKPGKRLQVLMDSIRNAQPPESHQSGQMPIERLTVENLDLIFTEKEGILPGLERNNPAVNLTGNLLAHNHNGNIEFDFTGALNQELTSGTQRDSYGSVPELTIKGNVDQTNKLSLDIAANSVALSNVFRELPGTKLNGSDVLVELAVTRETESTNLSGQLKTGKISYISPETNLELSDSALNLNFDLAVATTGSIVQVNRFELESTEANASVNGWYRYTDNDDFDVKVQTNRLGDSYRALLTNQIPRDWSIQTSSDSQAVELEIAGSRSGINRLQGKVALRGVHVLSPGLRTTLRNLHGDVLFDENHIELMDMTGDYAGIRVALDGNYIGEIWNRGPGKLDMKWSAVVPLEKIVKLHASQLPTPSARLKAAGTIAGHGTWTQDFGVTSSTVSTLPNLTGEFNFNNIEFDHNALPSPISGLNGSAQVDDDRLVINDLVGTMQGNKLEVSGEIRGHDVFWQDPHLSVSLQSRLDFSKLGTYLTPAQKSSLDKYNLKGVAESEITLDGPLTGIASRFTGSIRVSNAEFSPNLEFMNGRFQNVDGMVSWDGKLMELENVTGELNGERIKLQGELSAHHVQLSVLANPNLENVIKTFPRLDKYFDMTGGLTADIVFSAGKKSDDQSTLTITQMTESVRTVLDESIRNKTYSLDGSLEFSNASIRHISMPPARKENGRDIPAGRLQNLSGVVHLKDGSFSVAEKSPLTCHFSDTENCRVSGTITLRADHFPSMQVHIATNSPLKLDTWALGWGESLDRPDKPLVTGKKFDLDAEIIAPSVIFRGQQTGRSRAKLSFNMVQNDSPRVTNFKEVVLQGRQAGTGHVTGNGKIESFVWNKRDYPKWETNLDVQNMPLESLLAAVFREPSNIRGMITGSLSVNGTGADARSIRGQGSGAMRNLELGGTAVIRQLGQTTGRNLGGMQFQTARAADFQIGNGALSSRDLALETNGLQLEMHGDYWFAADPARNIPAKTIDGALRMRLFKSVLGHIPIIGQVAELADEVTNTLLVAFRVTGTADNPRVSPIALPLFQGGS